MNDSDVTEPRDPVPAGVVAGGPGAAAPESSGGNGRTGRWRALALPVAAAGVGIAAVTAVHLRDPHIEGSWGVCPVYALFGVYCPGCGGMRAVHNLTDGNIIDSLHSNLLALPVLVLFALWVGDGLVRAWRGENPRLPGIGTTTMWVLLGSLAIYTVLRNTPWGTWLTPV